MHKIKLILISCLLLFLCPYQINAASITSTQTGNWEAGGTWVGGTAPTDGDIAIITEGHTVTITSGNAITVGANLGDPQTDPTIALQAEATTFDSTARYYWIVGRDADDVAFTSSEASNPTNLSPSNAQRVDVTLPTAATNVAGWDIYRGTTNTFAAATTVRIATDQAASSTFNDNNVAGDGTTGSSIGTLPSPALYIAQTGTLVMNDDLTVKGDIYLKAGNTGATITQTASDLTLTSSDATTTVRVYSVWTSITTDKITWTISGTSKASPAMVQGSGAGIETVYIGSDALHSPILTFNNFKFQYLGSVSADGFKVYARSSPTKNQVSWTNGYIDNCGKIHFVGGQADDEYTFQNITWTNSLSVSFLSYLVYCTGINIFSNNIVDGEIDFYPHDGCTVSGNIFSGKVVRASTTNGFVSITNNFFNFDDGATKYVSANHTESFSNNYWYTTLDNPHYMTFNNAADTNVTITGDIYETDLTGGTDDGDIFILPSNGMCTATNNIAISSSDRPSQLLSAGGSANSSGSIFKNNTMLIPLGRACSYIGETYVGHADMVAVFRNNLCINTGTTGGYILADSGTDDEVDDVLISVDYNGYYNLSQQYYNLETSSYTYGAHDINANPQFIDSTRNLAAWDTLLGGVGTAANAITELQKLNDATGYDDNYNIEDLVTWIKAGFSPQNSAYDGTGSPTDNYPDIGAVDCTIVETETETETNEIFYQINELIVNEITITDYNISNLSIN